MSKNNKENTNTCDISVEKEGRKPVESNSNAAWAGIEKQASDGKVPIPSIENVEDAKDWVDNIKK